MSERPGGAPFMDRLPRSVVERYEATQKTAAKDEPYLHASNTLFEPGDYVLPTSQTGVSSLYSQYNDHHSPDHVYVYKASEVHPDFRSQGRALYEVEPEGDVEPDPEPGKTSRGSYRAPRARVVRMVHNHWRDDRIPPGMRGPDYQPKEQPRAKTAAKPKITLYRGEGSHEHPSLYSGDQAKDAGGWWTIDQEQAKGYADSVPGGKVYSLEIEPHEGIKSGSGVNYFIEDPEVRARRQEWAPPKTAAMSDAERQRFRSGQCLGLACEMAKRQGGRVGLYTGYGNSLVHAVSVHPQTGSHWDIGGENDPEILHEMYTDLHGPIEYHEVSPEEARQRKFDDLPEQDFDEAARYAHRVLGTD